MQNVCAITIVGTVLNEWFSYKTHFEADDVRIIRNRPKLHATTLLESEGERKSKTKGAVSLVVSKGKKKRCFIIETTKCNKITTIIYKSHSKTTHKNLLKNCTPHCAHDTSLHLKYPQVHVWQLSLILSSNVFLTRVGNTQSSVLPNQIKSFSPHNPLHSLDCQLVRS